MSPWIDSQGSVFSSSGTPDPGSARRRVDDLVRTLDRRSTHSTVEKVQQVSPSTNIDRRRALARREAQPGFAAEGHRLDPTDPWYRSRIALRARMLGADAASPHGAPEPSDDRNRMEDRS